MYVCVHEYNRRMKSNACIGIKVIHSCIQCFHLAACLLRAHRSQSYPPSSSTVIHHTASHGGSASSTELACCLLDLSLMLLLPATRCNICEMGEMVEKAQTLQQGLTYL